MELVVRFSNVLGVQKVLSRHELFLRDAIVLLIASLHPVEHAFFAVQNLLLAVTSIGSLLTFIVQLGPEGLHGHSFAAVGPKGIIPFKFDVSSH